MFCKNCGREIKNAMAICPRCGIRLSRLYNGYKTEGNIIAILGLIFAFFMPIIGIICSVIGYNRAKRGAPYKDFAFLGIIISIIDIGLYIILALFVYALLTKMAGMIV